MTNKTHSTIYTGVTNNLRRRVYEHKQKLNNSFTARYHVTKLIYYEVYERPYNAIQREKQIKAGSRKKKIDLINKTNPKWKDLFEEL